MWYKVLQMYYVWTSRSDYMQIVYTLTKKVLYYVKTLYIYKWYAVLTLILYILVKVALQWEKKLYKYATVEQS